MSEYTSFPPQQLPLSQKTRSWRRQCVDWGDNRGFFNYSPVRNSVVHKKINYDLLNGKLHMSDLAIVLNPNNLRSTLIPENIVHYPIMNSKLNVLRGEESKRVFDYKVVITNPNALSEIEETKKQQMLQEVQAMIADQSQSEDEFNVRLEKLSDYYTYDWQDMREVRANALLNHYSKEQNFPLIFNNGFMDGLTVGEEIYQCSIVGGEPLLERVNPLKIRAFRSGYSNRIEDADCVILEDYWSPGKVIDYFYDVLSPKDMEWIRKMPDFAQGSNVDAMGNIDERRGFVNAGMIDDAIDVRGDGYFFDAMNLFPDSYDSSLLPYDVAGNIRVMRMYWKSRRKIKKVRSYDPITGEEVYNFYDENYQIDPSMGEVEDTFWVNQAWEGTKIGTDIYVNMRPCPIQYNRLSNPSRCHFGIVGSIYNLNDSRPFSMVDMMKHYNYLYDIVHDRLNKVMSHNWGKLIQLDIAKVPKGWDIEKWMYYAEANGIAVVDSFKEGNIGASTGKLAGGLNNNTTGVIDAEFGNSIQSQINLLEFIKLEMGEIAGISRQREGQVSNRETVGGVERANVQSSHITEWLFVVHDDVKRRALECFLETAKIAMRGRSMKFNYILSDNSMQIMSIDGDEFAENDYGIVVDSSDGVQQLNQKMEMLAQAALQNQTLNFSTIMKLYNSSSLAEKERLVEKNENEMIQRAQQQQEQQAQIEQQKTEAAMQQKSMEMQQQDIINQRDNETKIIVANISANASIAAKQNDGIIEPDEMSESEKQNLREKIREFDARLQLDRDKFNHDKRQANKDNKLKEKQLSVQKSRPTTK